MVTRKFLLLSPWTMELLAVSVEEAQRRLIRPPGSEAELIAELLGAEAEAVQDGPRPAGGRGLARIELGAAPGQLRSWTTLTGPNPYTMLVKTDGL